MTLEPLGVVPKLLEIDLTQIVRELAKAGAIDMDLEDSPAVLLRRESGENHASGIVRNIGIHDVNRNRLIPGIEPGIDERTDSSVGVDDLELSATGGANHGVAFGLPVPPEVPGDKHDFRPRLYAGLFASHRCRGESLRKEHSQGASGRVPSHPLGGASSAHEVFDRIQHLNLTSSLD